jgi:hypothetical protein
MNNKIIHKSTFYFDNGRYLPGSVQGVIIILCSIVGFVVFEIGFTTATYILGVILSALLYLAFALKNEIQINTETRELKRKLYFERFSWGKWKKLDDSYYFLIKNLSRTYSVPKGGLLGQNVKDGTYKESKIRIYIIHEQNDQESEKDILLTGNPIEVKQYIKEAILPLNLRVYQGRKHDKFKIN